MARALLLLMCIFGFANVTAGQGSVAAAPSHEVVLHSHPNSVLMRYWQVTGDLPSGSSFILRPVPALLDARPPDRPDYGERPAFWQLRSRLQWRENRIALDRLYLEQSREFDRLSRTFEKVHPVSSLHTGTQAAWIQLGSIHTTNVYNQNYPHGNNLEAIFPSRGLTTTWSLQASAALGPLYIRIEPTLLYDESRYFDNIPIDTRDFIWRFQYEYLFNRIDRPFRYRPAPYLRVLPGNSEAVLRFHGLAAGVSTTAMWWGPGYRNALLLSNNAEGFPHVTLRSDRPLRSAIGRFEFQAFWGQLEESGVDHIPPRRFGNTLSMNYRARPDDWRLFSGLMLTWQPRWTPGLTIGAGRTIMAYADDVKRWDQALFSFLRTPFEDITQTREDQLKPDLRHQYDDKFALYIRYVAPADQLEVYGEWGRNARPASWSDFMELPEHGMAWILGMNKFFPLGKELEYIRLG
ncbi:MAG: capsule assembly Wzi family protein, partial [Balneolales bacterium]|nr:capsule assembly Wzi family protein [Balneolales bacterium]